MAPLREEFAALIAAGERTDLARGALALARLGYPGLDPAPSLAVLDALADAFRARSNTAWSPARCTAELADFLFGECGFHGNDADYYDPRNSFLNDVLTRRTGIPITLAVVLIEVAARLDLSIVGVGFPGHFLVRVPGDHGDVLRDPFSAGRPISSAELLARYRTITGRADVDAMPVAALAPTGTLGILARMLRNLLRVYLDRQDKTHALVAVDLLLELLPDAADMRARLAHAARAARTLH